MKYIATSLLYWPIWLVFRSLDYPFTGMAIGAFVVVSIYFILWRIEFGTWKIGS